MASLEVVIQAAVVPGEKVYGVSCLLASGGCGLALSCSTTVADMFEDVQPHVFLRSTVLGSVSLSLSVLSCSLSQCAFSRRENNKSMRRWNIRHARHGSVLGAELEMAGASSLT